MPPIHLNKVAPVPIQLEDTGAVETDTAYITDVLVGEHHTIKGENGQSYVVWAIRIVVNDSVYLSIVVYKRYREMETFRNRLVLEHGPEVPPLPPKDSMSLQRVTNPQAWLEERRKGLQWFMTNVMLNPQWQRTAVVREFVLG